MSILWHLNDGPRTQIQPTASRRFIRQQLLKLPAPVVADALGYHGKTTSQLIRETGETWSRYAAGDHAPSPAD